jgi:glycerol kinase
LIWQLTGGQRHVTDVNNASRTLMLINHSGQWDDDLLSLLDIPRCVLPEVLLSEADFG